jgi:preprotein translocase subunit SecD
VGNFVATDGEFAVATDMDSAQVGDVRYYPNGYHWLVTPDFRPSDVVSAQVVVSPTGGYAIDIHLTDNGAAVFRRLANAAAANTGALNQIALFAGSDVVSASQVISVPSGNETEITGPFNAQQAAQIAVDISPA